MPSPQVFYGCLGLRAILVDENNQEYSSLAGVLFDKNRTSLIQFPAGLTGDYLIPDGVTNIAVFAFGSSLLNNVEIPDSIQTIGDNAFQGCGALTHVTIPNSVTSIGNNSFEDCPWLASVTIGSGITNIGDYAFAFNLNLASIYCMGNATTNVGPNTFFNDSNTTIYYLPDTIGWSAAYGGLPAVLWNPQAQTGDVSFGVQTNQFGFNITGTPNIPIMVEACTNLSSTWVPLQSMSLTNGSFYFSDPQWTNYPCRFYRICSP